MKLTTKFAPIALFTYNRLEHTQRTLDALAANQLANQSVLIVYMDAARNLVEAEQVNQVRKLVKAVKGFQSVNVIERDTNYGLAKNIIEGVTEVCKEYGHVIVIEDDIITSPYFLTYMNNALERYKNEPQIWHISGWNYPIDENGLGDAFFWRAMNCWGWATWADRWQYFEKNPHALVPSWDKDKIKRFNLDDSHDFWFQITANSTGKINTWAIFWYATIFEHNGLCLNPSRSFVQNIGNDGSGENCANADPYSIHHLTLIINELPDKIEESVLAVERIKIFYKNNKGSLTHRIAMLLKNLILLLNGFIKP